jgi:hypothetical protein
MEGKEATEGGGRREPVLFVVVCVEIYDWIYKMNGEGIHFERE